MKFRACGNGGWGAFLAIFPGVKKEKSRKREMGGTFLSTSALGSVFKLHQHLRNQDTLEWEGGKKRKEQVERSFF